MNIENLTQSEIKTLHTLFGKLLEEPKQKVEQAIQLGADCLISTDLSCLMHLQGYVQKNGLSLKTMHLADVLTSGW